MLKKKVAQIKLQPELVQPEYSVLDIGAIIGFYGILFSKLVGVKGQVYCFEPIKTNLEIISIGRQNQKNTIFTP